MLLVLLLLLSNTGYEEGEKKGAMLDFVPDKRSPLTGGHGGVRVQPQTLCTIEQKLWARHRGAENNGMGRQRDRLAFKIEGIQRGIDT